MCEDIGTIAFRAALEETLKISGRLRLRASPAIMVRPTTTTGSRSPGANGTIAVGGHGDDVARLGDRCKDGN
jgi:hypothetical protein